MEQVLTKFLQTSPDISQETEVSLARRESGYAKERTEVRN